jgi:cytochrome c oxidase subunit II
MPRTRHNAPLVPAVVGVLVGGLTLAALLGAADDAVAGPFTPDSGGSPNAGDIDTLYRIALYIGIVVFLVVEGTLIWSIWRYRRRRGGPRAAQIRGNLPLEIGWTVAAALILVVLTAVTFIYLDDIKDPPGAGAGTLAGPTQLAAVDQRPSPPGRSLNIDVNGQQFVWRYAYPGREPLYTFYAMVVPTDTTIALDITSSDVVHSWWIPLLGGKADAVPGHTNHTWFRISKEGIYRGVCAELCGYNHADMRAAVRAVSPARFAEWARRKRAQIRRAGQALAAERRAREEGP